MEPSKYKDLSNIEQFIRPSSKKEPQEAKGSFFGKAVKVLSNKLDRLGNLIKTHDWINNKEVKARVEKNITALHDDIHAEKRELRKLSKTPGLDIEKTQDELREKLTGIYNKIERTKSVVQKLIDSDTKKGKESEIHSRQLDDLLTLLEQTDKMIGELKPVRPEGETPVEKTDEEKIKLKADAGNPKFQLETALNYVNSGNEKEALKYYGLAMKNSSANRELKAEAQMGMAKIYDHAARSGQYKPKEVTEMQNAAAEMYNEAMLYGNKETSPLALKALVNLSINERNHEATKFLQDIERRNTL